MDCAAPLAGGGEVRVQFPLVLGATSTLPAGEPPVKILGIEVVTQRDPILMVLYGITLVHLAEELRAPYAGLLSPFYADDADFDGSARQGA